MEKRLAACNLCEAICGLELTIDRGRVTGVRGNPDDPLSRGHICPKGVAIGDIHADPDRLRHPVRRDRTTGEWIEIGWDEAFDLVADGIATAINEHGRDALGIYLGNPNVHSLGSMTHGVALVQSFRTRNKFSATSVDQLPHQLVGHLMYGHQLLLPVPDIDRTSYFLVFGANPMASNGSLMTVPDFPARLRELDARGGTDGRVRPAAHRDRQGRDRAPLHPSRHGRMGPARDAAHPVRRAADHAAAVRRRPGRGRTPGRRLHAGGRRARQRRAGRGDHPGRTGVRRRGRGCGVRADRGLDPGVRPGLPVGGPAAQPGHREHRPRRRHPAHVPGHRRDRPRTARPRALRQAPLPGPAGARVRRGATRGGSA